MVECVECGTDEDIVMHHTDYEEDKTTPVCRGCHQKIHADTDHRLYPNGLPEVTSIEVKDDTYDRLNDRKDRGVSFDDVVSEALDALENGEGT